MINWSDEAIKKTNEKLNGIGSYTLHLSRIHQFTKQIERTYRFSSVCRECLKNKEAIDEIILKIDEAVAVPGSSRREYDRLLSHLSRHMLKAHGIYPPSYFRNVYSFAGMVAGFITGLVLFKLFPSLDWVLFFAGLTFGSIAGYFIGISKDHRLRKSQKKNLGSNDKPKS